MEIRIDIDKELLHSATQQEREEFQTQLFCAASRATSDYGAKVDFSDPLHWVIQVPDEHVQNVRGLLAVAGD